MKLTRIVRTIPLAMLTVAAVSPLARAAIIAQQGFEGTGLGYTITGTGGAVGTAGLATDFPATSRVRSGSSSFQSTNGASVLTFDSVAVSGGEGAVVDLRLAAISQTSGNGVDATDLVNVFIAVNGAAFSATPDLTVGGFANSRWSFTSGTGHAVANVGTPATFAPTVGGDQTTKGYSWLTLTLPASATSFVMKVESSSNAGEIWAIDDVAVTTPEPASLGAVAIGGLLAMARRRRTQA